MNRFYQTIFAFAFLAFTTVTGWSAEPAPAVARNWRGVPGPGAGDRGQFAGGKPRQLVARPAGI